MPDFCSTPAFWVFFCNEIPEEKKKGSHHTCISLSSSLVKRVKHPGAGGGFTEVLFRHGKVGWVRNS